MNIAEVEKTTGITKQNIRYYEKEGLLNPKRNPVNGYREYDMEDIKNLKIIRILRKTGMSIEEIKKYLSGEEAFFEVLSRQRKKVEQEREELKVVMELCDELKSQKPEYIDVDFYLNWIRQKEDEGNMLYRLWEDYRQISKSEAKKRFEFYVDEHIDSAKEFTNVLLKQARIEGADITITKEGMYPEFVWNGTEYSAMRIEARFHNRVICEMKNPDAAEPTSIEPERRKKLKLVYNLIPLIVWEGILFITTYYSWGAESLTGTIIAMTIFAIIYLFVKIVKLK